MNDPASAEATYRPPAFELLTTARDVFHLPQPAPVLWRDPDPGKVDAVLSVGEVAILASAGGLGKSCLTLALAVETATAAEAGREYGNACGLRVKAGGAVLVSYEDSPARIGARLRWFTKTAPERFHHRGHIPLPVTAAARRVQNAVAYDSADVRTDRDQAPSAEGVVFCPGKAIAEVSPRSASRPSPITHRPRTLLHGSSRRMSYHWFFQRWG